jgi:hypothetical protein
MTAMLRDGIDIIPKKFRIRASLGLALVEIARKSNDTDNLLLGYATAFYSDPTLKNLSNFLNFILAENKEQEIAKLQNYLAKQEIIKLNNPYFSSFFSDSYLDYGVANQVASLELNAYLLGRFVLEGLNPLLDLLDTREYLGFSHKNRHIAIVSALFLKSIAGSAEVPIIDRLMDTYCYKIDSDGYVIIRELVTAKANSMPELKDQSGEPMKKIEKIAVQRLTKILEWKKRGGYESACMMLVACAEAKEVMHGNGNALIHKIDEQFKRFSSFRRYLKEFTRVSTQLQNV